MTWTRVAVAAVAIACAIACARAPASAATSDLVLSPHTGAPTASFQFTYTLTLSPGDPPCSTETLGIEWDQRALGQIDLDCGAGAVSGVVTPPVPYNTAGPHSMCVGPGADVAPRACRSYVIAGDPLPNTTPFASPPECPHGACPTEYPTFEPDCIPTGKPVSPLCVTVTPIPYCDDGSHTLNSPPCADAMTSTPTLTPSDTPTPIASPTPPPSPAPVTPPNPCGTSAASTPVPACITPSPTMTGTPAACPTIHPPLRNPDGSTPFRGGTPIVETVTSIAATASACGTPQLTSGDDAADSSRGLRVKWGAVAIASAVVVTFGGAAGGAWWWRVR